MKPEQQRIAIAESCGWTRCEYVESIGLAKGRPGNNKASYGTYENGMAQLPDYLNDLNAMHEAENMLTAEQCNQYNHELCEIKRAYIKTLPQAERWTWGSSAAQRAEAFLRTINKWEETKL